MRFTLLRVPQLGLVPQAKLNASFPILGIIRPAIRQRQEVLIPDSGSRSVLVLLGGHSFTSQSRHVHWQLVCQSASRQPFTCRINFNSGSFTSQVSQREPSNSFIPCTAAIRAPSTNLAQVVNLTIEQSLNSKAPTPFPTSARCPISRRLLRRRE